VGAEAWYKEEILAMLCWITILGGVLIMMGQRDRLHRKSAPSSSRKMKNRRNNTPHGNFSAAC